MARDCPLITAALRHVGHQQTRNRGTIGGSLCHLDPGAELPVAAAALDAVLVAVGPDGERPIPFAEFSGGLLTNTLLPAELLARIELPKALPRTGIAFLEFKTDTPAVIDRHRPLIPSIPLQLMQPDALQRTQIVE